MPTRARQAVDVLDSAIAGPSMGDKRQHDGGEEVSVPKRLHFQVPDNRVFDANDPPQLLGVVASIPTRPPPPPSAHSGFEDCSLQEHVTAMEACQAHLEAHIGMLEHNGQVFQAWVAAQQYENQVFHRALEAQAMELREMVAALTRTIDQGMHSFFFYCRSC
ncbi:hypothetical protein NEOLEDRAFT_1182765 [Neolentinus lepideus HHB14362 ss-1]|uniref:Uncharacterized protein n=1 Tax=Neolentinus lepideus HHB14362 ss-1 TaxID=1314782 RepID=A0A165NUH7_9AGAM|nr:hypothetical protein NEOLEDRAFT_1182765 [Neolentinus lepideus HHB14362 ss-1]